MHGKIVKRVLLSGCVLATLAAPIPAADALKVSENGRFLVKADGAPFFYLADTAWGLLYRLTREEAEAYLRDRAAKRFTVIQAVALSGNAGEQNTYGQTALLPRNSEKPYDAKSNPYDPTRPNDAYFGHVDYVVGKAEALGLYVGMLPTWGSNVTSANPIIDASNARAYGEFLGRRYREKPIIWILGGDQNGGGFEPVWRAMAEGLAAGDGGAHLMTYHPRGGASSSKWFHRDPWLAFNMIQSGHSRYRPRGNEIFEMIGADYALKPVKPCLDGEPGYENIPDGLTLGGKRSPTDAVDAEHRLHDDDVRRMAYWSVFAGALGHTYGANGVMQFTKEGIKGSWRWDPKMTWGKAIQLPGASQMQHLRALIESRPFLIRIPDQGMIVSGEGRREDRVQATRASDGSYAFVYITTGGPVRIAMNRISGGGVTAYWYDPRRGTSAPIGRFANDGVQPFTPPTSGRGNDWVLVLDDAARNFGPPGAHER